jgi:hypothetical protein
MTDREFENLKASLRENIDHVNELMDDPEMPMSVWHWHVGFKSALKEVLQALEDKGE